MNVYRMFLKETITEHRKTMCTTHARDLIDAFLQKMEVKSERDPTFTGFLVAILFVIYNCIQCFVLDDQLVSLCLDLMMAGSETTSNTLSYCVTYMILYPEVQKKVQAELDEVIGSKWPTLQDRFR